MEKKLTNKNRDNTIYLSENDARALGIIEGDTQSIFIDGKKVDLLFVDEHEIFDATADEKRILNNALNLRKRELAEKMGVVDKDSRTTYLVPYGTINDDTPDLDNLQVSTKGKGFFGSIKTFFGKKHKPVNEPAKNILERSKYRNRTDIFTDEEIQIIQEVISRSQRSSSKNSQYYQEPKVSSKRKTTKNKKIQKAKGHELSTLNSRKASRNLADRPVTSPKKKQARRAARRGKK